MRFSNFFRSLFIGIPIGITILDSIGYVARVDGISMQPALNPDRNQTDYVFLNRWAVKSFEINRGDIISLVSPKDPSQKIIKRVVGIQGDIVATLNYKNSIVRVPEGYCWVEGDHTGHSMDSNNFGPVSLGLITAKASCIVWPPSRWQFIPSFLPDSPLVDKIEFQFSGNVARNAVTLGDVDNDGCYELIIGNSAGDVAIFKGKEKVQTFSELGFIACIAVGDIFNKQQNNLVIVTADGWFYIYENIKEEISENSNVEPIQNVENFHDSKKKKNLLKCIHIQRIPANVKNIVLGDIDEDGKIEVILGLSDRVVRSYRWLDDINRNTTVESTNNSEQTDEIPVLGRLVALNKWECANQIGSITLHHSIDNRPALLVAQPGGTFMRIRCQPDDGSSHSSTNLDQNEPPTNDPLSGSSIDYQYLGRSRMRNENISTEIIGDFKTIDMSTKICPYAVATLDGTIMLVQDEVIRWAIAVNHQIFALTKLDITGNGADDIVVCSWDGQTYFLDQDKNCVSFNLDEPVQAFDSGYYNLSPDEKPVTALVYVTFKNTIILYYDIPLKDMVIKKYNIDSILIDFLMKKKDKSREEIEEFVSKLDRRKKSKLIALLLYEDDK